MDGANQVPLPVTGKGECSEATVEIKIKTLDSQTYTLRVNKFVSVPALKEEIANVTGVLSDRQRLICRGKVLKDNELLSAYHVEDGHTLHLVVRQPMEPSSSPTGMIGTENVPNLPEANHLNLRNVGHNLIFGAVNLTGQGYPSSPDLSRIFSSVINSLGSSNIDSGSLRAGSTDQGSESHGRTEHGDSPDPSQIQWDQTTGLEIDQHRDISQFPSSTHPTVIPDSLTTLSQYIDHMQRQFDVMGPCSSPHAATRGGEGLGHASNSAASQGLPTPATLADVVLSGRQLLIEQAAGCLSELASQLQSQSAVSDAQTRSNIQSYSMRSGVLLQNLGSLLLELGRTIMTVRMGQTPDEAVVNAGPAIFISASSPNPIMVQAAIGLGSSGSHPGHVLAGGVGGGLLSRNIDIRIRRGPAVTSTVATNSSEPSNEQQHSGRADSSRRAADNLFHRILQGVSSATPSSGESNVRVVPIRTVIAIPAGVGRPSSDSSGNPDSSLYPLFARVQEQLAHAQQYPVPNSASQGPIPEPRNEDANDDVSLLSTQSAGGVSFPSSANEPVQHQQADFLSDNLSMGRQDGVESGVSQTDDDQQEDEFTMLDLLGRMGISPEEIQATIEGRVANESSVAINHGRQETPMPGNEDGVFFSSLVRQLMPFISQGSTMVDPSSASQSLSSEQPSSSADQTEGHHFRDAENRRDPPNDPAAKRLKKE